LSLVVRPRISVRTALEDTSWSNVLVQIAWASFLTMLIAGPWLAAGYLFGTDWPGPRRIDFPTDTSSAAPLGAALAVVSLLVSGEVAGKFLVLGSIFIASVTSFRAVPSSNFVPKAAGSLIYVANPFVYGRLHYGQLFLLAGYAALPWVAYRLRLLLLDPRVITASVAGLGLVLLGMLSLHLIIVASVLTAAMVVTHLIAAKDKRLYARQIGRQMLLTTAIAVAGSAYWLIPLLAGRGREGGVVAGTGTADLTAYAAIPDASLGLLPNLLGLYGFWAENSGRFTSMKAFVLGWPIVLTAILAIAAIGATASLRRRSWDLAPWVAGLVVTGAVGLVLESGVSHPATSWLVTWLDYHLVPYRGMRDAGKWAALLALIYSQLVGLGAAVIMRRVSQRQAGPGRAEWVNGAAAGLLLALPLYYGNGLLFGMHGEIRPSTYPAGWYAADRVLASDPHPGHALFLPWHEYMSYSFVRNQNRVVASPAPNFFSVPIVVSTDPEVPGVVPLPSPYQGAISTLVRSGGSDQWAPVLTDYQIKYVLLVRELDWSYFAFLDAQPGLSKVGDFGSIVLYRNVLVP
jgi:hypothetical protein